jgi:CHAP domain
MSGAQVLAFAQNRLGERVGGGQCFDLVDAALRSAGHRSAADYGALSPRADYVWGTAVQLGQLLPGDVVQFSNYRMLVHVATRSTDGSSSFADEQSERPHHTAIVESVGQNGEVTVLEQNVQGRHRVLRNTLRFSASTTTEIHFEGSQTLTTTRTVTVSGQVWYYRPQAR